MNAGHGSRGGLYGQKIISILRGQAKTPLLISFPYQRRNWFLFRRKLRSTPIKTWVWRKRTMNMRKGPSTETAEFIQNMFQNMIDGWMVHLLAFLFWTEAEGLKSEWKRALKSPMKSKRFYKSIPFTTASIQVSVCHFALLCGNA